MSTARRNAASQELAQWLGETHPQLYDALFAHALRNGARALSGLGDVGDDFGLSDFTPQLQDVSIDQDNLDYVDASSMGDIADALPLFDDPVGGTQSVPVSSQGSVTSSTQSVGQYLTSGPGLTAIANLGTAVLNAVATTQVAKAQMAVVQAQAQRAQNGQSPLPITYVEGPNGQVIPVYNTGNGTEILPSALQGAINGGYSQPVNLPGGGVGYTLNSNTLSSLFGSNSIWLVLGAMALGLVLLTGSNV